MVIVDTHCHASPYWFEPVEVLLDQMNRNGVDKAALIQVRGVYDNSYLIECMRRFPGRFSSVVIVDIGRPDAPDRLHEWVLQGAEGVRLSPSDRSPGSDPLAIWRSASEMGLVVSSLGTLEQFASREFEGVVRDVPNLKIIIEHLGGVGPFWGGGRSDKALNMDEFGKVLELAKYPNTYMKVPGLGEFCPRPSPLVDVMPFSEIPPVIEMAIEAFGAQRMMWGSDFPPSANREGYRKALRLPMENVKFKSEEDKEWVFGKTAMSLWKFA